MDAEGAGRRQLVELLDPASGAVLDGRTQEGFSGGAYLSWEISSSVRVRVTHLGGGPNAVVGGVFLV